MSEGGGLILGALALPNRLVLASGFRRLSRPGGLPEPLSGAFYIERSVAGLVLTEPVAVSPDGLGERRDPGLHSEAQTSAWSRVAAAVRAEGSAFAVPLWHAGRLSHPRARPDGGYPVAPSSIAAEGVASTAEGDRPFPAPRALTTDEIGRTIRDFARAAVRARSAGFDAVEIHGADGGLGEQFLRSASNQRSDAYGGSPEARALFLRRVVDAVAEAIGPDRVGLRLPASGPREQAVFYLVTSLRPASLAWLHLTDGDQADELRRAAPGPVLRQGAPTAEAAAAWVADGLADGVVFGEPAAVGGALRGGGRPDLRGLRAPWLAW
jgi:N-ethylmaleimide reductase